MVGVLLYPYPGIDIGVAIFTLFGLSSIDSGGVSMFITPVLLLLAFISSLIYGAIFICKKKKAWQFLVEVGISVMAFMLFLRTKTLNKAIKIH